MRLVQRFHGLQFDQKHLRYQQVHAVLAEHYAVIGDRNVVPLHDAESRLAEFMGQSILMRLLQKPDSERIEHGKCTADDVPRQVIQPISICVRLLLICVKTFFL